ncbi:MAG: hypothetical protein AAFP19_15225 [Bacteroidota bacterium]
MNQQSVNVKILESEENFVKVELPFVEVPVFMNREFFNKRIKSGYFNVLNREELLQ